MPHSTSALFPYPCSSLLYVQVKGAFTAAAPISVDTLNYFASLDIPVYEVRTVFYLLTLLPVPVSIGVLLS